MRGTEGAMATLTLHGSITGVVPHKRCVKKLFFHNSARKKYFPQYQSRCSVIERAAPVYQGAGERGGERKGDINGWNKIVGKSDLEGRLPTNGHQYT